MSWDDCASFSQDRANENMKSRLATAEAELIDLRNAREDYDTWIWHENYSLRSRLQAKKLEENLEAKEELEKVVAELDQVRSVRDRYKEEATRIWELGEDVYQKLKQLEVRLEVNGDMDYVQELHENDDLMERAEAEFSLDSDDEEESEDDVSFGRLDDSGDENGGVKLDKGKQKATSIEAHPIEAVRQSPNRCLKEILAMVRTKGQSHAPPSYTSPFFAHGENRFTDTFLEAREAYLQNIAAHEESSDMSTIAQLNAISDLEVGSEEEPSFSSGSGEWEDVSE